jgi:hypothetical protein
MKFCTYPRDKFPDTKCDGFRDDKKCFIDCSCVHKQERENDVA